MKRLLIVLALIKITAQERNAVFVDNPLAHGMPCENNSDIYAKFESGLPPGEENQYHLIIKEEIPQYSQINLKFDSDASLTLTDPAVARISLMPVTSSFNIRFFKSTDILSVKVKGPPSGTIPYVKSIQINYEEVCTEPNTGYFDGLITGIQDTAEISHNAPDDSCGRRKIVHTELIVNGQPTNPGDWPWHAALYRVDGSFLKYICGGSLLSTSVILTAAHCTTLRGVPIVPRSLNVILGKHYLVGGDIATQEREILEVIIHPSYNAKLLSNDIAMLKLKSEAIFDDYVQPVCLWNKDSSNKLAEVDIFGTVVGWGFDHSDKLSATLRQATMPKVSEATCLKSNPIFFSKTLNSNKFCAGYTNGTSACNGDSGGGFHVFIPDTVNDTTMKAGAWHIRGIVSMTLKRSDAAICDPNHYVLFTDVTKYKDWIEGYLKA